MTDEKLLEVIESFLSIGGKKEVYTVSDLVDFARYISQAQREEDTKLYSYLPLKDVKEAWKEFKKNAPTLQPVLCFLAGARWNVNQGLEMDKRKEFYDLGYGVGYREGFLKGSKEN